MSVMKFPRPKALTTLILIGFALVALPLMIAAVQSAISVGALVKQSEGLVIQGVEIARRSQILVEQIPEMKRTAQRYVVLPDITIAPYEAQHRAFINALNALNDPELTEQTAEQLARVRLDAEAIMQTLREQPPASDDVSSAIDAFDPLASMAAQIGRDSSKAIDQGLDDLQVWASDARRNLAWQLAALIPVTFLLVLIFTRLISKPIRQIEGAIQNMGGGRFSKPIHITGPQDLEALGRQLDWLRLRLLELAQEKNKFLRHMSHELKTPLANIREGSELLVDGSVGQVTDSQKEVISILRNNGIKLQQLIENLLTYSAWQSKEDSLEIQNFSLKRLIESMVEHHHLQMVGHDIKVNLNVEDIYLDADRDKIRLVVDNLLSNAAKYSPPGGTIYVAASHRGHEVILDVADDGVGIPEEDRERIFEVFYQSRAPEVGHVRGTGIGLTVVRESVLAHGGSVEIIDGRYKGAHFRVRLPQEREQMYA